MTPSTLKDVLEKIHIIQIVQNLSAMLSLSALFKVLIKIYTAVYKSDLMLPLSMQKLTNILYQKHNTSLSVSIMLIIRMVIKNVRAE